MKITTDKNFYMPKYLIILAMLYLIAFIFPVMLAYRIVQIGRFIGPGGTMFFPASYLFADIIAEVYGYKISRQILWTAICCQMTIAVLIFVVLHLPYPSYWHYESDFEIVLGHSLRYALASTVGNFCGEFTNIYLISKFKIFLKGKYFWMRSVGASCLGEAALTMVVFFISFEGVMSLSHVFELTVDAYIFKSLFAIVAAFPAIFVVRFLKKSEAIDVYDQNVNFNPFKLAREE